MEEYFQLLPEEITLDILTRLTIESVLDFKSVCKNWDNMISNHPLFSKMHFNHSAASESGKLGFLVSTFRPDGLHYFEYDENHDKSTTPITRITRIVFTPPFKNFDFRFVCSINGLVCLLEDNRSPSVCICNPITKEYLIPPEIRKRHCDIDFENTSFGYASSTNEYKIVRFYKLEETHLEIHIYTLGSGKGWRNLGKFDCGSSLYVKHKVFFANGALYWLDNELEMIATFDLTEEKFGEHLAPPPLPPDTDWFCCTLGVLSGFLFFGVEDGFPDIWLLKKKNHDKEVGEEHAALVWNEGFRIGYTAESMDLLAVTKSGDVFTNSDNHYINIYDTKTSTSKGLVKFKSCILQVCPHKNTLVSLKELGEEDTKVMKSAKIEGTESREQLQEDADPDYIIYIYL